MRSIESSILLVTSKVSNEDLPYSPPIFDKRTCIVENRNVFSKIYPAIKNCLSVATIIRINLSQILYQTEELLVYKSKCLTVNQR